MSVWLNINSARMFYRNALFHGTDKRRVPCLDSQLGVRNIARTEHDDNINIKKEIQTFRVA